ncbi:unnamed protein product [Brassicogethes aeneus]|uniref:Transmembrane protein 62 n=1 Tax=Brassicogethes aeneus TaxID=1431903 RepID=A0A9P0B905_BRAAE|nr:unnamed protein product [Brassicogethes aeneus]
MRVSKSTIGIFISMILLSIFLANVLNLLSTDALAAKDFSNDDFIQVGDSFDHLIWFLQISDIHISIFRDPSRITQFREFCHYTVNAVEPSLVLASGDLTDAKTSDAIGSEQFEDEWKHYRGILDETKAKEKTVWLDIRGNHDNFNVAGPDSKQNFFTNYSVQGKAHPRSYMYQLREGGELYTFIAVDACLEPGPKRPFNFVGILDQPEVDEINELVKKTRASGSNYTVWFGHFPTSCTLTVGEKNARDLIGQLDSGLVYVCGHLHKLGGIVPKMYAMQKAGFLELELGDWKENRVYRLIAIDHGLLSFVDQHHNQWPLVLITNPKNALFFNPQKENLMNIKHSTHIRVLAFSLDKITSVKVRVNRGAWIECANKKGPLYVVEWNPLEYNVGIHNIEAEVRDVNGRKTIESQPFAIDGSRLSFSFLPKMTLMTNASAMFRAMFAAMIIASIVPLSILKYLNELVAVGKMTKPKLHGCGRAWLRRLWLLSTVNRLFWPMILYPVYLIIGPWSIGYLVEDHIGVIFAWGIFVNGAYLPGSFTYAYGFIQLVTFQVPLTLILAKAVDHRFKVLLLKPPRKESLICAGLRHLPFALIFTMQVIMAYLFWLAYGTMAFFLGPLRTWSIILALFLYYEALFLPEKCTRKASFIWIVKVEPPVLTDDRNSTTSTNVINK